MASFHPNPNPKLLFSKTSPSHGLSQSFAQPSFDFFERHFTDVSESGYLHKKNIRGQWEKFWFEIEDGVLFWLPLKPPATHIYDPRTHASLSLDKAASIRTDSQHQNTFEFKLAGRSILLRAASIDERNKWMHSFHLCIAGLISKLIVNRQRTTSCGSFSPSPTSDPGLLRARTPPSTETSPVMPFGRRNTNMRDTCASPSTEMEPVPEIEPFTLSDQLVTPVAASKATASQLRANDSSASKASTNSSSSASSATSACSNKWVPPHLRGSSSAGKWVPPHLRNGGDSSSVSSGSSSAGKWVPPHLRNGGDSSSGSNSNKSAGKWVPPHLRNSDDSSSVGSSSSGKSSSSSSNAGKWVPPHLRNGGGSKWVPPHRRGDSDGSRMTNDNSLSDSCDMDTDDDEMFQMEMDPPSNASAASMSTPNRPKPLPSGHLQRAAETATSSYIGVTSTQGTREKMEDVYVSIPEFGCKGQSFYAVYDGHCGIRAAQYAADKLHKYILQHPMFKTDCKRAVSDACGQVDEEFVDLARQKDIYDGTTAVFALLVKSHAVIATIGDSYCVLSRGGKAVELSVKLTPGNASERARIEAAGGWITEERELFLSRLHHMELEDPFIAKKARESVRWITTHRVNGELSVSRAIGDPDYKGKGMSEYMWAYPKGHSKKFTADLVLAVPHIKEIDFQDDDEFFILACDGLWDVLDSQDAIDIVSESLKAGVSAQEASHRLTRIALKLGTSDNITIIVVKLNKENKVSKSAAV